VEEKEDVVEQKNSSSDAGSGDLENLNLKAADQLKMFRPGKYRVLVGKTISRSGKDMNSSPVQAYKAGDVVQVVEVINFGSRLRGRLDTIPESWISLKDTKRGKVFFEKIQDNVVSQKYQEKEPVNNQETILCGLVLFTKYGALLASLKGQNQYEYNISIPMLALEEYESPLQTAIRAFTELTGGLPNFNQLAIFTDVISYEQNSPEEGRKLILLFPAYIELDDEMELASLKSENNLKWIPTSIFVHVPDKIRSNVFIRHIRESYNLLEVHKKDIVRKIREQDANLVETVEMATQIFLNYLASQFRLGSLKQKEVKSFFHANPEDLENIFDCDDEAKNKMRLKMIAQLPSNESSNLYITPEIPVDNSPIRNANNWKDKYARDFARENKYLDENKHPLRKIVHGSESNQRVKFASSKKSKESEEDIATAWTPGKYMIIKKSFTTKTEFRNSPRCVLLEYGDIVNVVEIKEVKEEYRIRGRLNTASPSWVSLKITNFGTCFARKVGDLEESPTTCDTCGLAIRSGQDAYEKQNYFLCKNCHITFGNDDRKPMAEEIPDVHRASIEKKWKKINIDKQQKQNVEEKNATKSSNLSEKNKIKTSWNNGEFSLRNSNQVETILIQMIQLLGNENQTEVSKAYYSNNRTKKKLGISLNPAFVFYFLLTFLSFYIFLYLRRTDLE